VGGLNNETLDPEINIHYLRDNAAKPMQHVLSNSFGFGGSNCSVVLSKNSGRGWGKK
jgi:3-oxoacyl-[acyl-carrier-protein] synthase I